MGCHPQREYAAKCLPRHGSRLLPSRTRVITALSNASCQAKGGEGFTRRDDIQSLVSVQRSGVRRGQCAAQHDMYLSLHRGVEEGSLQGGPAEVGPADEDPAQVRVAEVGPTEIGLAEIGPAQIGS